MRVTVEATETVLGLTPQETRWLADWLLDRVRMEDMEDAEGRLRLQLMTALDGGERLIASVYDAPEDEHGPESGEPGERGPHEPDGDRETQAPGAAAAEGRETGG